MWPFRMDKWRWSSSCLRIALPLTVPHLCALRLDPLGESLALDPPALTPLQKGETVLHLAVYASGQREEMLRILVRCGGNVHAGNEVRRQDTISAADMIATLQV
jgi:hypothetical protein